MQLLGLLIILVYLSAAVGPMAAVYVAHNGNIQEMMIPPEVQTLVEDALGGLTPTSEPLNPFNPRGSSDGSSGVSYEQPQYVSSTYNLATRTVAVVFNFTNPLNAPLAINQLSADVKCHAHGFQLGHAAIPKAVEIPSGQTVDLTVVFAWTEPAQEHILSSHSGVTTINVDLVNIVVNVSGITIEVPSAYNVDIPLS